MTATGFSYRRLFPHNNARPIAAPTLPVLHGRDRRGDWWPGVPRRCAICRGHLTASGGTPERDAEIACLMCGRAAYTVRW